MRTSRLVLWKLRETYRSIPNAMFVLLVCSFVLVVYLLTSGEGAAPASVHHKGSTTTWGGAGATPTTEFSMYTPTSVAPPRGIATLPPLQITHRRVAAGGAVGARRAHRGVAPRRAHVQRRPRAPRTPTTAKATTPTTHR